MIARFLAIALLATSAVISLVWGLYQRRRLRRLESAEATRQPGQAAELVELRRENDAWRAKAGELRRHLSETQNELGSLSYSISHDLRAPLRSVNGFAQALAEDYHASLDPTAQDYLRRVCAGARHMHDLIEALLDLARITRAQLQLERVDLSALARQSADALAAADPARRVEWHVEPGVVAWGDRALLGTALHHLLGNAWKFSAGRDPAHIAFRVGNRVDATGGPVYEVSDDGTGFDMQYAGKLFGAFQRLHLPDQFPGHGVGLAAVQRIVHRHGGSVWAEAAPTHGATFFFTLPAAPAEFAPAATVGAPRTAPVPLTDGVAHSPSTSRTTAV